MTTRNGMRAAATVSDPRWAAVVKRDRAADGGFFYSVRTTGVYCRPSCGARTPKPENVAFHRTAADAQRAGFRPCKRCKPDVPAAAHAQAAKVAELCRFIERAEQRTRDLVPHSKGLTLVVGTVERDGDLYNAAAVMHDGRWIGTTRKRYLPNYGVFDENRYFMSEPRTRVFERSGVVFGVNVCEDIWVGGGAVEDQVVRGGAEVVLNLSASPYHHGKTDHRRRMIATRAVDHLAVVGFVNLVGGQDEVVYDGASLVVDQEGRTLAEGAMFEEDLVVADLDLDEVFNARLHDTRLRKERAMAEGEPVPRVVLPPVAAPAARPALPAPGPRAPLDPYAEIYKALVTGTRDYVRKTGFDTVVIGLSGGVDSALTACVAVDALGAAHVVGVSMPSVYTSSDSQRDAEALAGNLGVRFMTVPIRDVFDAYAKALAPPFAGRPSDITEENLQARIRGTLLMALSNKFGAIVLTTGNKSEMATGYCTLYGDMAGGFAVIKDVAKTLVYRLAEWRNRQPTRRADGSVGPVIPERIITRAPSAELRPNQTDQDSLPPYEVLDAIVARYVEDNASIADLLAEGFAAADVERVTRLIKASEYKRQQAAVGTRVTRRSFGKDWRYPMTNRYRV